MEKNKIKTTIIVCLFVTIFFMSSTATLSGKTTGSMIEFGTVMISDPIVEVPKKPDSQESQSYENWPMFSHDSKHSGFSNSKAPDTNKTIWIGPYVGNDANSLTISNNKVYASSYSTLLCISAINGSVIWTAETDDYFSPFSTPTIYNNKVYIGARNISQYSPGRIYCFDAETGKLKWNFTADGWVDSSPTIVKGRVYFSSHGKEPNLIPGKIYCIT